MNLSNLEIRKLVIDSGVQYKDIAKKLGMSREWLSRCMRNQLSQKMEDNIRIAIDELKSSEMESDLKRCPFCGGKASVKGHLKGKYAVGCDTGGCLVSLFPYDTIEEAIAAWNRRAKSCK